MGQAEQHLVTFFGFTFFFFESIHVGRVGDVGIVHASLVEVIIGRDTGHKT